MSLFAVDEHLFAAGGHLRSEALLLLDEGDLNTADQQRADLHLHACTLCKERLAFVRMAELELPLAVEPLPPAALARERLQGALESAAAPERARPRPLHWLAEKAQPALLLRLSAVAALLLIAVTFRQVTRPLQELMGAYEDTGPEPDHTLTPGSASLLSVEQVCQRGADSLDPPVDPAVQRAVFRAYRMSERTAQAYQVDYLINPQLGGDGSLRNLWPEPYHATVWNAAAKDALETRLHGMVCHGQLDLGTAQRELAEDWIAAYKKYFHTKRPVQTVATVQYRAKP